MSMLNILHQKKRYTNFVNMKEDDTRYISIDHPTSNKSTMREMYITMQRNYKTDKKKHIYIKKKVQ